MLLWRYRTRQELLFRCNMVKSTHTLCDARIQYGEEGSVLQWRKMILVSCVLLLFVPFISVTWAVEEQALVAIDAGHGGGDGGAVAADGTLESSLNLKIAQKLEGILCFAGCPTVMIRTGEESLADGDADTVHQQKVSDLKNRVALIQESGSDVLISIHQNSLPGHPNVHGAQTFYNTAAGAGDLAAAVQYELNRSINPSNEKICKPIGDDIYLMKKVDCPAILVECGFMSNPSEVRLLQSEGYQKQLAATIAAAYLNYVNK